MYWLSRPPVIRYLLASAIVLIALWLEIRPTHTVAHPFAATAIAAGSIVTSSEVEFRSIPSGILPPVSLPQVADHPLDAGDPITPSGPRPTAPPDWWALELPNPGGVSAGSQVRLVIAQYDVPTASTLGIVLDTGETYGEPTALVAVAEEWADLVAAAAHEDRVILMVSS